MTPNNDNSNNQKMITKKLRSLYSSIEEEEVPNRILDLLDQLDRAEKSAADGDDSSSGEKR